MSEWIKDFNVIHKGELFRNCVEVRTMTYLVEEELYVEELEVFYIDSNGMLNVIRDDSKEFKFVRK